MQRRYEWPSEKDRRRCAAVEAAKLGYGGLECISQVLDRGPKTIQQGRVELKQRDDLAGDRVRSASRYGGKEGGGCRPWIDIGPQVEGQSRSIGTGAAAAPRRRPEGRRAEVNRSDAAWDQPSTGGTMLVSVADSARGELASGGQTIAQEAGLRQTQGAESQGDGATSSSSQNGTTEPSRRPPEPAGYSGPGLWAPCRPTPRD